MTYRTERQPWQGSNADNAELVDAHHVLLQRFALEPREHAE